MRIALAQINSFLGDFEGNAKKIIAMSERAVAKHADMVVFPEASLFGYHPMDLLERASVVDAQMKQLTKLVSKLPKNIAIVFGAFTPNKNKMGKHYFNSALVVVNKRIVFSCAKELLPTYDVFDDARHIEAGDMSKNVFKYKGKKILITICEDIWAWPEVREKGAKDAQRESFYPCNPIKKIKKGSVDLIINLSASPFFLDKVKKRHFVVESTAKYLKAPMVYVNMVGAQDELIFDGGSFAVDKKGKHLAQSIFFEEDLNMVDLNKQEGGVRPVASQIESLRSALVLGLRDYCAKSGIKDVVLGLSGGIDSALVACIAVDALGPGQVQVVALPGPFSSPVSEQYARELAKNLGVQIKVLPITSAYEESIKNFESIFDTAEFGLTNENMQARLRCLYLMALSNRTNAMLLNTSNKSEMCVGYSTMYGDLAGGLAVIGDLLKGDVVKLCEYYNREREIIPKAILTRAPSAELRANQKDEDSLPPYNELDASVVRMVEKMKAPKGKVDAFVLNRMMRSEFKRWQAPPILKVRDHSFGRGRRLPVAHKAIF